MAIEPTVDYIGDLYPETEKGSYGLTPTGKETARAFESDGKVLNAKSGYVQTNADRPGSISGKQRRGSNRIFDDIPTDRVERKALAYLLDNPNPTVGGLKGIIDDWDTLIEVIDGFRREMWVKPDLWELTGRGVMIAEAIKYRKHPRRPIKKQRSPAPLSIPTHIQTETTQRQITTQPPSRIMEVTFKHGSGQTANIDLEGLYTRHSTDRFVGSAYS